LESGDLVADPAAAAINEGVYPRIRVDETTGAVDEGFLQFVELPFPIGTKVTFTGTATLRRGAVGVERARTLVAKALALVPAVGGVKSAGFGRLAAPPGVGLARAVQQSMVVPEGRDLELTYEIDAPFVVGGSMATPNLFMGEDVIPGGAIKGTLATALADETGALDPALGALLENLVIGHAFPRSVGDEGRARTALPLSLVRVKRHRGEIWFKDLLHTDLDASEDDGEELVFLTDDKAADERDLVVGQRSDPPGRVGRTRTKIDPETASAAYENDAGQLFSYAAIRSDRHQWCGRIVVPDGVDDAQLATVLGALDLGVGGLGKTGARIRAVGVEAPSRSTPPDPPFALTLQTPAVLNDPDALRDGRSVFDDFAAYWDRRGYTLRRCVCSHRLVGGYLALRYPPRHDRLEPYLVTEPGSVFLVDPGADARPLDRLLREGLPVNDWIERPDWRHCPFLPQNGYGQVLLDVVDHAALRTPTRFGEQAS
jgi:hypothetical protein